MRAVLYCAISACTSGSLWIACSASAWRRVALGGVARAGVSTAAPASISSRTARPSASASAACSLLASAGVRRFSRSTRSRQTCSASRVVDATHSACIASSRTSAAMLPASTMRDQRVPAIGRAGSRGEASPPAGRSHPIGGEAGASPRAAARRHGRGGRPRGSVAATSPRTAAAGDAAAEAAARARRARRRAGRGRGATPCAPARRGANASRRSSTITSAAVLVGRQRELGAAVQDDAVEQLRLVGRQQRRQARRVGRFGIVAVGRARHRLQHRHLLQQRRHLLERAGRREAELAQAVDGGDQRRAVARRERLDQPDRVAAIDRAEHLAHARLLDRAAAVGDRLVGERQRVAHRAARRARDQLQRRGSAATPSCAQHRARCSTIVCGAIGRRLNCRQRDSTVAGTFCGSVVASTNLRYSGGSSSVFSIALKAWLDEHVHFVDHVDLEAADTGL